MSQTGAQPEPELPAPLPHLAPRDLPRDRSDRYRGEGAAVRMSSFAAADRRKLKMIYDQAEGLYRAWLAEREQPSWPAVEDHLAVFRDPTIVEEARTLGRATLADSPDEETRRVLHDVRGGGLSGLIGQAEMVATEDDLELVREAVFLGRDHAKMMRQAIVDLDPARRATDEREKRHDIEDVARKWRHHRYRVQGASAEIGVDCRYHGGLASRCLEAAAVDRILYNLVNNATRFAADGRVELFIFPVGNDIRFVVVNVVEPSHVEWLAAHTDGDLGRLFLGGITRGGTGIGLSNCAGLVAAAYGQPGPAEAVQHGHVGARVVNDTFHAWFHWPTYA